MYKKSICSKLVSFLHQHVPFVGAAFAALLFTGCASTQNYGGKNFVRLSKIELHPSALDEYNSFLKEEISASMDLEPGVLALYAVSEKQNPSRIVILEIYADKSAYEKHLKTPHFRKYKDGTSAMVKNLELVDVDPLLPGLKIK